MGRIDPKEIREHLERVMASPTFTESERLCRFLRFTVEAKLADQPENVKEFILGREVFDRKDDYDPRLDPIVRVEARRLRVKLAEYYSEYGRRERFRITYPKGSYLPSFDRNDKTRAIVPLQKRKWVLAAAILVVATLTLAYLSRPQAAADTMVAVLPASWLWPSEPGLNARDATVAEAVDDELANRQLARVIAWPVVMQYQHRHLTLKPLAKALGASNAVVVLVRNISEGDLVTVFLVDTVTGEKRRAFQFVRHDILTFAGQQAVARDIASSIAAMNT